MLRGCFFPAALRLPLVSHGWKPVSPIPGARGFASLAVALSVSRSSQPQKHPDDDGQAFSPLSCGRLLLILGLGGLAAEAGLSPAKVLGEASSQPFP